jgi:YfiH family protein
MILPVYQSQMLNAFPRVKHGFFTRQGGVSKGSYSSLNMALDKSDLSVTASQVHSSIVYKVVESFSILEKPTADALVTSLENVVIGVLTADCAPILVYAPEKQLIASIHAGWKGAKSDVIANTIIQLEAMGAQRDNCIAVIGPTIQQESYEVDEEFYDLFLTERTSNQQWFKPHRLNHYLFDLPGYVCHKLTQERLSKIEHINVDTYKNEELFFSYRRTVHRQESVFGNQISAIMLA